MLNLNPCLLHCAIYVCWHTSQQRHLLRQFKEPMTTLVTYYIVNRIIHRATVSANIYKIAIRQYYLTKPSLTEELQGAMS